MYRASRRGLALARHMTDLTDTFSQHEVEICGRYLRDIFGPIGRPEVERILLLSSRRFLRPGVVLFSEGDPSASFFIVLSGRLRSSANGADGPRILGDIARGEPVGEIAFFTKAAQPFSVVALKHSLLLEITNDDYLELVKEFPGMSLVLTQFVVQRLRQNTLQARAKAPPRTVAVINLCRTIDLNAWAGGVKEELGRMAIETFVVNAEEGGSVFESGRPMTLEETRVALRRSAAALPPPDEPTVEEDTGMNVLLCDDSATPWTRGCVSYADVIVLAVDFQSDAALTNLEQQLELYSQGVLSKRVLLLLFHPANGAVPSNTARWLEPRRVDLHLHLRVDHDRDRRRFCRVLTNRAIGLVLGGGGAKGMAHLGAVQALQQAGLEFDFIGGTSAGALIGAVLSQHDFNWDHVAKLASTCAKVNPTGSDFAIPFLALKSGKKMRALLQNNYGDSCVEDLWTNFFCLTTNYSAARPVVLERGLTRKMVEASIAIPGVFPPVMHQGHLHVDGGVFDNLPIECMLTRPVRHIVAIALQVQEPREIALEQTPGSWPLLLDKLTGRRRFRLPSLPSILINSLTINSYHKQSSNRALADFLVELDLRKFGLLDWSKWRECWQEGHRLMVKFLTELKPAQEFWVRGKNGKDGK